ncbi:MAG TPA: glycosyltransferase family 4 protein [bacterium]|jgi:1,2-diacylglycerol-3-alpha-glucose alpha-1,2-galactosyltransferase|nr:glycosyltransferase family 4 protein [bacterium]
MPPIRVNVVSESGGFEAQGVHTAFVDMIEALKLRPEVEILVNSKEKADILHAHTFGPAYWTRRHQYRGRRVMTAHVIPDSFKGSLVGWRLWMPLAEFYLKFAYNSAEVVLAVAPHVKSDLERIGVSTRVEVLTNPVNGRRFHPDPALRAEGRRILGLSETDQVALGVGQVQPRKGVAEFIDTAALRPDVKFFWFGGRPFGSLTDSVKALDAKIHGAAPNVKFPGTVNLDAMPALYSAADLFFFPSWQENCALAINEAMACGIPMLLKDNVEYPALYGAENYLKASDPPSYAAEVGRFFGDAELRKDLKRASIAVADRFSVESYADYLVKLYQDLMAEMSRR